MGIIKSMDNDIPESDHNNKLPGKLDSASFNHPSSILAYSQ